MTSHLLQVLIDHLPQYTQEGAHTTSVSRTQLQQVLQEAGSHEETANLLINLIERLLVCTSTLEPLALTQQRWQFVSFSARLLAHSLLQYLKDDHSQLLPSTFWQSDRYQHEQTVDQQHQILAFLETRRVTQHSTKMPTPIRHVAIAASWFKLADQFIMHRREMNKIRDGHGEYVLIGGRVCYEDIAHYIAEPEAIMEALAHPNQIPIKAFEIALQREIKEETGLEYKQDYEFKLWKHLNPCQWLAGTSADYSYTEYTVKQFHIELTIAGFLKLRQKEIEYSHHFARFNLKELWLGQSIDGKKTNMHILKSHFAQDEALFFKEISNLNESFCLDYTYTTDADRITLPLNKNKFIRKGINGKEKSLTQLPLSDRQCQLLWLLGAATRGFTLFSYNSHLKNLGYGWLQIQDVACAIELKELASYLKFSDLRLIEVAEDNYFRLTVHPNCVFFDEDSFCYELQLDNNKYMLTVESLEINTPLAIVKSIKTQTEITKLLVDDIERMQKQPIAFNDNKRLDDRFRKSVELPLGLNEKMGLRRLLRIEKKHYQLTCSAKK